jgi:hypothetical protein
VNDKNLTPYPPGVSGNPLGKPKGVKNFSTVMRELLASQDVDGCYATPLVKRTLQLIYKSRSDQTALNAIIETIDRIEGKVPNRQHISGDPENPFGVTINVNKTKVDKPAEEDKRVDTGAVQPTPAD